jgi:hypothetical protein
MQAEILFFSFILGREILVESKEQNMIEDPPHKKCAEPKALTPGSKAKIRYLQSHSVTRRHNKLNFIRYEQT